MINAYIQGTGSYAPANIVKIAFSKVLDLLTNGFMKILA